MKQKLKVAAGILGLILAPFLSYVLFEYVTGNLSYIPLNLAFLNVYWISFLYLILFGISGSSRITIGVGTLIFYLISLAETFVYSFRGRPIMLSEILAVKTALSVAGSYSFTVTTPMLVAAAVILLVNGIFWFFPVSLKEIRHRLISVVLCIGAVYLGIQTFYGSVMERMNFGINQWVVGETYRDHGYLLSSAISVRYMVSEEPEGYSDAKLEEIYQESKEWLVKREQEMEADAVQPVNIICIMNESFSELKVNGEYETNIPYFSYMDQLRENTVRGSLCVPVFGSLTSNTEYEFLTGDSMALLPSGSIAYQFFVKPESMSVVSTLEAQGYKTVAMHPYPGDNWNRRNCYRNMGFDEFLDEEHYKDCENLRIYVTDKADYEKLIEQVESKDNPEDKLFLFNVTMQNHGGYEALYESFPQEVWLTGDLEGKYPKTDQFLSLMKKSDEAIQYLLEYFEASEEPTMIVLFGDHQPGVEDEFFDEVFGMASADVPKEQRLMWYETPFFIWTNYEQEEEDLGRLSSVYLGSHMLDRANVKMTPYDAFLLEFSRQMPVVHFLGCYEADGTYHSWEQAESNENPFREELMKYEMLVYNHSIENNEMKKLYQIPE